MVYDELRFCTSDSIWGELRGVAGDGGGWREFWMLALVWRVRMVGIIWMVGMVKVLEIVVVVKMR